MATAGTNARWQDEARFEAHKSLVPVFNTVQDECAWRVDADEYHAGLYRASDSPGVKGLSRRGYEYGPATMPYNVCRSAVNTLQAKIAKHRPLPEVMTQRGNWKTQKRAKKQSQFLEGEFYRQRVYEKHAPIIVRDALIFGRGALMVWTEGRRIKCERVPPWELFADEWDARYGDPRNLYRVRSMDRGVALERFARTASGGWNQKIKQAIMDAGRFDVRSEFADNGGMTVDRIDIIEAWHRCDRPEEHVQGEDLEDPREGDEDEPTKDPVGQGEQPKKHKCNGRHAVVTTSGTLIDEEYPFDYFPPVVLNYEEPVSGCWGAGLVEQLEGYQVQINESSEKVAEQFKMSGVHIMVPDNAKIQDQAFRNGIHITRHAAGGVPQIFQADLVNEHTRQRPRELTEDALNDAGVSQMSAQSQKPAGIESGIGLQTLDDIETERFMIFGRAYEAWNLELARRFVDCAKQIAAAYGDHAVSVPMKGGLLNLKWSDVYVDGVELRVFPTSLLPQQLGARLDKLKTLFDGQIIDRATFLRHLDAPDLQAELDLETADRLVIDEMLDRMLDAEEEEGEGAYMAPSAYQDLKWAGRRAQQKLNRAILDNAPEFNREMLRRFLKEVDEENKKLAAKNAPTPAPANMNGAPPAPGAMPPAVGLPPAAPPMAA